MKSVAGRLKLELAQFREVQAFSQFASDLDKATQAQLARGLRIVEILKQPPYEPVPLEKQVVAIYAATNGYLDDLPVGSIKKFEAELISYLVEKYPDVLETIAREKTVSDSTGATLKSAVSAFKQQFHI
jgi:F-type H+-transporting ATPase subunit alpha